MNNVHAAPVEDAAYVDAARVAALAGYRILDTPPERGFDDIVLMAARICAAPVALISLVTDDRQWFKAGLGFDACQTPIAQSVCAHALLQPGVFVIFFRCQPARIPDLAADPRTRDNTLVTEPPHIRFYAGARLESSEGVALGTLCVIDNLPRPAGLTPEQGLFLEALARQVMAQMELRRAVAEKELLVQEAHHRVKNSLQMVQSLLTLQAKTTAHPQAAQQLRESAARVLSFAAMHENLYRIGGAPQIDLGDYLGGLMVQLKDALSSMLVERDITLRAGTAWWPSSDAPSIGLILIERDQRAEIWALASRRHGRRQGETIALIVSDGRPGPADRVQGHSKGLACASYASGRDSRPATRQRTSPAPCATAGTA